MKDLKDILGEYTPKWYQFHFDIVLGMFYFSVSNEWHLGFDILEWITGAQDGDQPILFFDLGFFHMQIESPRLYDFVYKRRHGRSCYDN